MAGRRYTMPTLFLVLFCLAALAHFVAEALHSLPGRWATKPLLMPLLAAWYLSLAPSPEPFLLAALAAAWLGDIFLMLPDRKGTKTFFKVGLVAFLLGHLLYLGVFLPMAGKGFEPLALLVLLPCAVLAWLAARLVLPHAGAMRKAIIAYMAVIAAMAASTLFAWGGAADGRGGILALAGPAAASAGALVFMVSDTLNAYNRFVKPIRGERGYTMGTYLAGQFLIVSGCLLMSGAL